MATSRFSLTRMSLTQWILASLFLGIFSGLFFGEYCAPLKTLGDIYIGLIQMTVLPYITVSIISSVGQLSFSNGKKLALWGSLVMLSLWAMGALYLCLLPMALPDFEAGSFFSTSLIEQGKELNLLQLFVPSNPFNALANNLVPAVVVFCILMGVALIRVDNKELALSYLKIFSEALTRVNGMVVKISPVGLFAIAASTSGTMQFDEFDRLQAYVLIYSGGVLILTFVTLPLLIVALTPFTYRQVIAASRNASITAFVTGSVFVVIPMLIEDLKALYAQHHEEHHDLDNTTDIVIPLGYPFPDLGRMLSLIFIPFAAWFYGDPLLSKDYPLFLASGILGIFGSILNTIPFLLEKLQLPTDIFQLFLLAGVYTSRIGNVLSVMHLIFFTLLTSCLLLNLVKVNYVKLLRALIAAFAVTFVFIFSVHDLVDLQIDESYSKENVLSSMQKMKTSEEIKVLNAGSVNPAPLLEGEDVLDRILRTKTLRVGFDQSRVPFTFYNMHDELVGFDIDMAMALAKDLGVSLVFVPCKIGDVEKCLANDEVDIIMSGMYSSIYRAKSLRSSVPYMNVTFAMVVKDHLREQCDSLSKLLAHPELNIAIIQDSHLYERGASLLPHATFFHIEEEVEFFENTHLDIMVVSAEEGSAWTLMYPQYRVIQPLPRPIQFPVVYLMGRNAPLLDEFLDTWVPIVKNDGTVGGYYDYWILGRDEAGRQSRWSIMKDVLGWVD